MKSKKEDSHFVTRKEWKKLQALLLEILKDASDSASRRAENNIRNFKSFRGVGAVLFRSDCIVKGESQPTWTTFQSIYERIGKAMRKLPVDDDHPMEIYIEHPHKLSPDMQAILKKAISGKKIKPSITSQKDSTEWCVVCTRPAIGPPVDCWKRITESRTILVGTTDWPPFIQYRDMAQPEKFPPDGVYCNLMQQLEAPGNTKIICTPLYKPLATQDAMKAVQSGDIDVALGFVETTRRRQSYKKTVDFVAFTHLVHFIVVVRTDANPPINSVRDIAAHKTIVRKDSGSHDIARDLLGIPDQQLEKHDNLEPMQALRLLETSELGKATICDGVTYQMYMDRLRDPNNPQSPIDTKLTTLLPSVAALRVGIVIRKEQQELAHWLKEKVREVISREEFVLMEDKALKPYRDYVQKCWNPE